MSNVTGVVIDYSIFTMIQETFMGYMHISAYKINCKFMFYIKLQVYRTKKFIFLY